MKRPIVWATIFTICGIYMRLGISELMCLVSFIFIFVASLQFVIKEKDRRYLFLLLFTLIGFSLAGNSVKEGKTEIQFSGIVEGTGVIREAGLTSSGNQKLTIKCDLKDEHGYFLQGLKIYAIWTGEERFETGDKVGFFGEAEIFYEQTTPGGYDEDLYLTTKGYDCKVYLSEIWLTGVDTSLSSMLAKARETVHETLDRILPVEESGIMKAMLTGDKDDIPEEAYDLYRKAGVVHVLCISGLHMSCLALYVSFFMEKVLKRSRRASAVVTMLAAVSFLAFSGVTPSAVRAVTMICVVMTGRVIFRLHDRLNEIAFAALLILLIQPLYLFHIGFQLSFITVIGLCLAAEKLKLEKKKNRKNVEWLKESFLFSLYASLFSFPLVAYHFYSVSLIGILANLVVLPLSGLLLGIGILSAVFGMIWMPAGVFAAGSVYAILQLFKTTAALLLQLPFAYVLIGRPSELVILLYYGLLFCWMRYGERKGCWKIAVTCSAAMFLAMFENNLFRKETTVAFLDVGQGDAAVISTYDRKTYLIDGGGEYGKEYGENVGKTIILPYLEYLGVRELDGAFLSHPDSDHMTGLMEVIELLPVKGVYVSDYPFGDTEKVGILKEILEKCNCPVYTVKKGASDDGFECLYPMENITFADGDDNHGSMVLKYTYGDTEVLFTGDITAADERLLLEMGEDVSADILKVSHHGSKYSSDSSFLEAVSPETAVISCGKNNIYGHPHENTLDRMNAANIAVYRTDDDGSVLLRIRKDGTYEIENMTERKPLYERIKETVEK